MTPPTAPPTDDPPVDLQASAPARPRPTGVLRATAVVATLGVVVALLGLGLLLRPVTTPLQDCGTTLRFLLDGGVNEYANPDEPPRGLTADEVRSNNERPCRVRVADAAQVPLVMFAAGLVVSTAAAVAELSVRGWRWRQRRRGTMPGGPPAT